MSLIKVTNLSFSYEGSPDMVFENVSFQLDTNWKLGFIGRNGRGKTTFLRILQGQYEYTGTIHADIEFEYFPYKVPCGCGTVMEMMQKIAPDAMEWEIERELSLLEVKEEVLDRPFSTLSDGEQTKALLAVLFLRQNSYLLIDEPTNHLDEKAREVMGRYLKRKKGFLLVSHDRALLDTCVDHILSINKTNIEIQKGNFSTWQENKRSQDNFEIARNERLKKDISRLSEASQRNARWSDQVERSKYGGKNSGSKIDKGYVGHKAAKMMKRSKTIASRQQTAIEEKSRLLHNIEIEESLAIVPLIHHKDRLVEFKGVSVRYAGETVLKDVSFSVNQGERVALCGKNGCGKSSILKLICGEEIPYEGEVYRAPGLRISYLPQKTSHLRGTLSAYAEALEIDESIFKSLLRKMDFARSQLEKKMEDFSEGQKKKVLLAGSLCEKAHLYIWDEPLNFIDVISRIQIEELLRTYQPTLLFVEHDAAFRKNVASRIVEL